MEYLYDEGRRDIVLFAYMIGFVSYDEDENMYLKTAEQRLTDAIKLSEFLVSSGDFVVGETVRDAEGQYGEHIFEDFENF